MRLGDEARDARGRRGAVARVQTRRRTDECAFALARAEDAAAEPGEDEWKDLGLQEAA